MPYTTKEIKNEYMRRWKKKNRDKVNRWNKAYIAKDPERWKEWRKNWEKENYEHRKATARRVHFTCENCHKKTVGFRKSQRFCSRKCMGISWAKPLKNVYRRKWIPSIKNKIPEHRWVMEQMIGRKLLPTEVVHHKDHNRKNNSPSNLKLFKSNSEHMKFHASERAKNKNHN